MSETPKQSDQLPEEGPAETVPDDVGGAGEGAAREEGERLAEREAQDTSDIGYRDSDEEDAYEKNREGGERMGGDGR
jgi:hypothetical protein